MSADPDKRPLVSFLSVISLGNLLIVAGMVGTGIIGIYTVGGSVQKLQDAQEHEIAMRVSSEANITRQITDAAAQEQRDVSAISKTLDEIRGDFRSLVQANTPQPEPRRR
jgi:hypothetical protein